MATKAKSRWRTIALVALGANVALAVFLVISATSDKPDGSPKTPEFPVSWDDQRDVNFIHNSGFKHTMRQMWMNANTIASAGSGEAIPDFEEIAISAKGIARKSAEMATFWESVLDAANDGAEAAPEEDWFGLAQANTDIWKSCNHCHRETWSMAYSHVDESIVDVWKQGKASRLMANQVDAEPAPKVPNRTVMQRLSAAATFLAEAVDKRDAKAAQSGLATIIEVAKIRLNYWKSINAEATTIEGLADRRESEGMKMAYRKMTGVCLGCHTLNVAEERDILTPIAWR